MNAQHLFATIKEAEACLDDEAARLRLGVWIDARPGEVKFEDYAKAWVDGPGHAESTKKHYHAGLRLRVFPTLGKLTLNKITHPVVRNWYNELCKTTGHRAVGQACENVRAILDQAVTDRLIKESPFVIRGFNKETPARPFMEPDVYYAIREQVIYWLHPLLDLTWAAHLRIGEVMGLQRRDLDLGTGILTVRRQITKDGDLTETKTKRTRRVKLPDFAIESMTKYLEGKKIEPMEPLFVRPDGKVLRRSYVQWAFRDARNATTTETYSYQDIRHSGLTLYAQSGATLKETMERGGHSTTHAAMIYQHAEEGREGELADRLNSAMKRPAQPSSVVSDTVNDTTEDQAM